MKNSQQFYLIQVVWIIVDHSVRTFVWCVYRRIWFLTLKQDLIVVTTKYNLYIMIAKSYNRLFVIYADFESTLQSTCPRQTNLEDSWNSNSKTHTPNSFCCSTQCAVDKYFIVRGIYSRWCWKMIEYLRSEVHRECKRQEEVFLVT